jgi:epoxyqueuosine reductase
VISRLAAECGFDLAGVACAEPLAEFAYFRGWVAAGMAGAMRYLTDRRGELRADPRNLLPTARSIICVGKRYDPQASPEEIEDYHVVVRRGLENLRDRLRAERGPFDAKICVDTAPLLERAYARWAGLGFIGKNHCLINQARGSWFFLGELLVSLELTPGAPPPDRCGSCTRCIEACPTGALTHFGDLDARLCIAYRTIEMGEDLGEDHYGCTLCQQVCPWNRHADGKMNRDAVFDGGAARLSPDAACPGPGDRRGLRTLLQPGILRRDRGVSQGRRPTA